MSQRPKRTAAMASTARIQSMAQQWQLELDEDPVLEADLKQHYLKHDDDKKEDDYKLESVEGASGQSDDDDDDDSNEDEEDKESLPDAEDEELQDESAMMVTRFNENRAKSIRASLLAEVADLLHRASVPFALTATVTAAQETANKPGLMERAFSRMVNCMGQLIRKLDLCGNVNAQFLKLDATRAAAAAPCALSLQDQPPRAYVSVRLPGHSRLHAVSCLRDVDGRWVVFDVNGATSDYAKAVLQRLPVGSSIAPLPDFHNAAAETIYAREGIFLGRKLSLCSPYTIAILKMHSQGVPVSQLIELVNGTTWLTGAALASPPRDDLTLWLLRFIIIGMHRTLEAQADAMPESLRHALFSEKAIISSALVMRDLAPNRVVIGPMHCYGVGWRQRLWHLILSFPTPPQPSPSCNHRTYIGINIYDDDLSNANHTLSDALEPYLTTLGYETPEELAELEFIVDSARQVLRVPDKAAFSPRCFEQERPLHATDVQWRSVNVLSKLKQRLAPQPRPHSHSSDAAVEPPPPKTSFTWDELCHASSRTLLRDALSPQLQRRLERYESICSLNKTIATWRTERNLQHYLTTATQHIDQLAQQFGEETVEPYGVAQAKAVRSEVKAAYKLDISLPRALWLRFHADLKIRLADLAVLMSWLMPTSAAEQQSIREHMAEQAAARAARVLARSKRQCRR
jgi:hypothetical protein